MISSQYTVLAQSHVHIYSYIQNGKLKLLCSLCRIVFMLSPETNLVSIFLSLSIMRVCVCEFVPDCATFIYSKSIHNGLTITIKYNHTHTHTKPTFIRIWLGWPHENNIHTHTKPINFYIWNRLLWKSDGKKQRQKAKASVCVCNWNDLIDESDWLVLYFSLPLSVAVIWLFFFSLIQLSLLIYWFVSFAVWGTISFDLQQKKNSINIFHVYFYFVSVCNVFRVDIYCT